jgi:hypothetical protein
MSNHFEETLTGAFEIMGLAIAEKILAMIIISKKKSMRHLSARHMTIKMDPKRSYDE